MLFPIVLLSQGPINNKDTTMIEVNLSTIDDETIEDDSQEYIFKPKLSLGIGMFTFYGDVSNNHGGYHPTVSRLAYELRLINPLTDYLDMNFYVLFGQVSAHERSLERNLNFNSHITTGGLTLTYNFKNFRTWKSGVNPYISLGIESVEWLSKSDMRDANGNYYHYWSDGSIMSMAENDPQFSECCSTSQRLCL
jgi:hypothetical protein